MDRFSRLAEDYPDVMAAYEHLGGAVREAGDLDGPTRRLVRLALAIGAGAHRSVRAHARLAVVEGTSARDVRQVAIMAITTLGIPQALTALDWIDEELGR